MRTIRQGAFETNSSSAHTIVIPKQDQSIEDLVKNIDPEIKAYIEKNGLLFGMGKRYNDPFFSGNEKIWRFQLRLDFLLDNIADWCEVPEFVRAWQFMEGALKKQPFPYKINLDPEYLRDCGCHDSRETIESSKVLEDESQFLKFIFSPISFLAYDDEDLDRVDKELVNIYEEAPYGGSW